MHTGAHVSPPSEYVTPPNRINLGGRAVHGVRQSVGVRSLPVPRAAPGRKRAVAFRGDRTPEGAGRDPGGGKRARRAGGETVSKRDGEMDGYYGVRAASDPTETTMGGGARAGVPSFRKSPQRDAAAKNQKNRTRTVRVSPRIIRVCCAIGDGVFNGCSGGTGVDPARGRFGP